MTNVYIHYRGYISNALHKSTPGRLADGQHKRHMKKCLKFKKKVVGHMTLWGSQLCWWET